MRSRVGPWLRLSWLVAVAGCAGSAGSGIGVCPSDTYRCTGDELERCRSDGSAWIPVRTCPDGCSGGACLSDGACKADCTGRDCGPDGCGGTCGGCDDGIPCSIDACDDATGRCLAFPDHSACPSAGGFCNALKGCTTVEAGVPDSSPVAASRVVDDPILHMPVVEREVQLLLPEDPPATAAMAQDYASALFPGRRTAVVGFIPEIGLAQVWVEAVDQADLAAVVKALRAGPIGDTLLQHLAGVTSESVVPGAGTDADYGWDTTAMSSNAAWHLDMARAPAAWSLTTGDPSLGIGILELDGVDFTHPDLQGNVGGCLPGPCDAAFLGIPDAALLGGLPLLKGLKPLVHGTHVAGLVAAIGNNTLPAGVGNTTGMLWRASLRLARSGPGHQRVEAAFGNLAKAGARVINMSLAQNWVKSRHPDYSVREWVDNGPMGGAPTVLDPGDLAALVFSQGVWTRLLRANPDVLVVQGAGNAGDVRVEARFGLMAAAIDDPELEKRVLTVASLGRDGLIADFSGTGGDRLAAPGGARGGPDAQVLGLGPAGTTFAQHGTSMATPVVTGVAGLMLSINPALTPRQVHDMILATAHPIGQPFQGQIYGRVDAYLAVLAAQKCLTAAYDPDQRRCPGGTCEPACGGRQCGDDGCGAECGPGCGDGERCSDGHCVTAVPDRPGDEGDHPDIVEPRPEVVEPEPEVVDDVPEIADVGDVVDAADTTEAMDAPGQDACLPSCAGRQCGDDGCGGRCGACQAGTFCLDGRCANACPAPECVEMVTVPGGPFMMGWNEEVDPRGVRDELPYHQVDVAGFDIDVTEVTLGKYAECVSAGGCPPMTVDCGWAAMTESHPMICASWEEATYYCAWAGKRLCTEAEWEKAARGTDGRTYPWGNDPPTCDLVQNVSPWLGCGGEEVASPVAGTPLGASPYGVLDLAGNVDEWVQDCWHDDYKGAPSTGAAWETGCEWDDARVLRGGTYLSEYYETDMRASHRNYLFQMQATDLQGFRCCRSK